MKLAMTCTAIAILLVCAERASALPQETFFAGAAFNDASGLYSDATADSPYQIGATALWKGVGEPGWAVGWTVSVGGTNPPFGSHYGDIRSDVVLEGDGALRMRNRQSEELWMHRRWSQPLAEKFRIDQHVNIPSGGQFGSRPFSSGTGSLIGRIGPSWYAVDGKFYAQDGDGAGNAPGEFSGFTWEPDTWYKVSLIVDPPSRTFEFLVDDRKYIPPDPLGFRGTPSSIDHIRYLTSTPLYIDDIRVTIVPEPTTMSLAAIGMTGFLGFGRRKRR